MLAVTAPASGLRRRRRVLRVARKHGRRTRSALGDLRPRHRLLGGGDGAVRRPVAADPHDQRRPADPTICAADLHDADHRADHVDRRHLHGDTSGRRPVLAAADQRAGAGAGQLLDRVAPDADLPAAAAADRRHQPGDARAALRHPGDPGIRSGTLRAQPIRRREPGAVGHRAGSRPLAGADAAGHHAGDQHLQRRADLVRRLADRRRPDAGGLADRVPVLLHADPDGRAAGDVHAGVAATRVGVRRTDHRGAVHHAGDRKPAAPGAARSRPRGDPLGQCDVQLSRR